MEILVACLAPLLVLLSRLVWRMDRHLENQIVEVVKVHLRLQGQMLELQEQLLELLRSLDTIRGPAEVSGTEQAFSAADLRAELGDVPRARFNSEGGFSLN